MKTSVRRSRKFEKKDFRNGRDLLNGVKKDLQDGDKGKLAKLREIRKG